MACIGIGKAVIHRRGTACLAAAGPGWAGLGGHRMAAANKASAVQCSNLAMTTAGYVSSPPGGRCR